MPKFLNNIDLDGNELQNAVVHVATSAPTAVAGKIYFDSSTNDKALHYYNGSVWIRVTGQISQQATDTIASGDFLTFADDSETEGVADFNNNDYVVSGMLQYAKDMHATMLV